MEATEIKDAFWSIFSDKDKANFSLMHRDILDEAVESYLNGNCTFNGGIPSNRNEWLLAIQEYFAIAIPALNGMIKGSKEAFPNEPVIININYRGNHHQYKFDAE